MARRENPMAVRSKTALSQALLSLLLSKSFEEITISDITDKAMLSRQTFYTNFSRKEDILDYLLAGLFTRYRRQFETSKTVPDGFLVDYFIFWDNNKDFLSLIFTRGLGHLFYERNRHFFTEEAASLDEIFTVEAWQLPYIRASIAGLTYELLFMWVEGDMGLPVGILTALARNLMSGTIFSE